LDFFSVGSKIFPCASHANFWEDFRGQKVPETPYLSGDPGRTRTSDLQLRRLLLYPLSYGANPSAPSTEFFAAVRNMKARNSLQRSQPTVWRYHY
jgi:hypothetical protein